MLASPAGVTAVLAGRAIAASAVGLLHGGIVLISPPVFVAVTASRVATAAGVLVAAAVTSSVLGLLVAAPVRSVEDFAAAVNVVLFPLCSSAARSIRHTTCRPGCERPFG